MSCKLSFCRFLQVLERILMDILASLDGIPISLLTDICEAYVQYMCVKDWKGALLLKLHSSPFHLEVEWKK